MLEALDLSRELPKRTYKERLPHLQNRLFQLQRICWESQLGSLIVFSGWDTAGKGSTIKKLTERLEPRGFSLHTIQEPRTYETHLPWMWRFWASVPDWGEMAIFDRSWYFEVVAKRADGLIDEVEFRRQLRDIRSFERALADDRYVIVKLFLHISREEQARRLEDASADPLTSWEVTDGERHRHQHHDAYLLAIEEALAQTETEWAPWSLIEATDRYWTRAKVFETIIARLEGALSARGIAAIEDEPSEAMDLANEEDLND